MLQEYMSEKSLFSHLFSIIYMKRRPFSFYVIDFNHFKERKKHFIVIKYHIFF